MSLPGILFWLDAGVCAQTPSHVLLVAGQALPLCARDLGLFGGFLLAASLFALKRMTLTSRDWLFLAGVFPIAVDGGNSFAWDQLGRALYQPNDALRLASGLLAGVAAARLIASRASTGKPAVIALTPLLLVPFAPYAALALVGTLGVVAMLATATRLALDIFTEGRGWAALMGAHTWMLWPAAALELTVLAAAKHLLVSLLA